MNVNELKGIKTRVVGFERHLSFICTGAETGKTCYFYMAKTSDGPGEICSEELDLVLSFVLQTTNPGGEGKLESL